jgi:hypothetical protein
LNIYGQTPIDEEEKEGLLIVAVKTTNPAIHKLPVHLMISSSPPKSPISPNTDLYVPGLHPANAGFPL